MFNYKGKSHYRSKKGHNVEVMLFRYFLWLLWFSWLRLEYATFGMVEAGQINVPEPPEAWRLLNLGLILPTGVQPFKFSWITTNDFFFLLVSGKSWKYTRVFKASALWADAFYKSKCPYVCLFVCLFVCSLLRYRLNVFLPPLPEVRCPKFLQILNPWGKLIERSGLRFEHFC